MFLDLVFGNINGWEKSKGMEKIKGREWEKSRDGQMWENSRRKKKYLGT
jgi:hypothetical protein